ncbi:restriction endonuclease subunit S [Tenacibaculum sp. FZY0031]|uniref:restriction endonuclease subunit S n=1 Tax=Tenacibaculum sp. FZY0031 TaxID=3116648 RepID=UPI002ECDB3E5|nr:restriction endonuclease subunit S [Tenacibaculum sp. FZY0031]
MEKAYETYKDSGLNYLGDIPSHWKTVKLKYIGEAITGITYSPNDVIDNENGLLVLRSSNIQGGKLSLDNNVYVSKEIKEKYLTKIGDILLCSRNGSRNLIGKNILIDEKVANETWGAFMTIYRTQHSKFAYYFFNSPIFDALSSLFLSSTINQLTIGVINNFILALPPKQEQTQIAAYLDYHTQLIDTLISKKETLIQKLQEQRQAIINEAVTKGLNKNAALKESGIEWLGEIPEHWEVVKLSHYSEVIGGSTPRSNVDEYWEGDISWVTTDDLGKVKNKTINQSRRTITEKGLSSCSASLVPENSLIISCRAPIGHLAINKMPTATNQGCKSIVPKEFYITDYLYYFFVTAKKDLQSLGTGSTFIEISTSDLKNYKVLKPSIKEQNEIVSYLDVKMLKLDLVFEEITKSIQKLKAYRQSLISEAVTGKIDVRDWQHPKNKS